MLENLPLYTQFQQSQGHQAGEEACRWPELAGKENPCSFMYLNSSEEQDVKHGLMYLDGTYYRPERDDGSDTDGGHGVLVLNFVPLPRNNAHGNAHCAATH